MLITILATIVVLGVLIFVHELGHFVTAKLVDIEVPRFSIGLGPKLVGFRRGETEYVISWLPLGGYVKMAGMEEMEAIEGGAEAPAGAATAGDAGLLSEVAPRPDGRTFESKSLPARALVLSAGVFMNVIFAMIVFAATALVWGVVEVPGTEVGNIYEERVPEGAEALLGLKRGARIAAVSDEAVDDWEDFERTLLTTPAGQTTIHFDNAPAIELRIPDTDSGRVALLSAFEPVRAVPPEIGQVADDSPAARAGLRPGDRVVEVAGQRVDTWLEMVTVIETHPGDTISAVAVRDGRAIRVTLVPTAQSFGNGEATVGRIGVISGGQLPRERPGIGGALAYGVVRTWEIAAMIVELIGDLFAGDVSPRGLGGPIMIGQLSGQFARAGVEAFLGWMALLSVNLAVLNLVPIPVLDGGQLALLGIEAVRGRALSLEQRARLAQIGAFIVLALVIWVMTSDVLRLFGL